MLNNSKSRFSKPSKNYNLYRPSYPQKLVEWIVKTTAIKMGDKITDLGCGTGISSRLFAERKFKVIGIDPNNEMLFYARKHTDKMILYQKGDSENTGLPGKTVDLAIAAQAFHWFDIDKTMRELKRILKNGGFCCAFWNVRQKTAFLEEYESLLEEYSNEYKKIPGARETILQIKKFVKNNSVKQASFPNSQELDLKGLIGRVYSTSYIAHGVNDHDSFRQALISLFKKYKSKGKVKFTYKTIAICWQP